MPAQPSGDLALIQAVPRTEPSAAATGATIDRLRAATPDGTLVGGPMAENHDLEAALSAKTALVIGVVLALGFLQVLVALQAGDRRRRCGHEPAGDGRRLRVAKLIFQDGHLSGLLGFESQGYLDAWGPVFFAFSMDSTVFLLSSAKEHWDRTNDAEDAMVGGAAHSGSCRRSGSVGSPQFLGTSPDDTGPAAPCGDGRGEPTGRQTAGERAW
jgi:RND superfamily putative drug exporter